MAKFLNTERKVVIESLVEGFKKNIDNPFYMNLERPTIGTYFNQNTTKSSVEEDYTESFLGDNSSIKYNKINNMFLYGLDKMEASLDITDWGVESEEITGEMFILPNVITPIPNDYFTINHANKQVLFKVISATFDMMDNGNNIWRISYKLDQTDISKLIVSQVEEEYEMLINNVGTNHTPIIKSKDYDIIEGLENLLLKLQYYYKALFYSDRVQTFIYKYNMSNMYDPNMIEFLIGNRIMEGTDEYMYISHQTSKGPKFILDYANTVFRMVETKNKDMKPLINSQASIIEEPLSILYQRKENYFRIYYISNTQDLYASVINNYPIDLIDKINSGTLYKDIDDLKYMNILIKYMNDIPIGKEDIDNIENINFDQSIEMFYNMPLVIFSILKYIENKLTKISRNYEK